MIRNKRYLRSIGKFCLAVFLTGVLLVQVTCTAADLEVAEPVAVASQTSTPTLRTTDTPSVYREAMTPTSPLTAEVRAPTPSRYIATPRPSHTPDPSVRPTESALEMWRSSITPISGMTPLATIVPAQRQAVYEELMATNGGCPLPCWWGFELGRSTLAEVRLLYEQFSPQIAGRTVSRLNNNAITVYLEDIGTEYSVSHYYSAVNDVITTMEIDMAQSEHYQIEPLLQQLGQPTEIWVWTHPEPELGGFSDMVLLLPYMDAGIFVRYEMDVIREADQIVACFDQIGTTAMAFWLPELWNPTGSKSFAELVGDYTLFSTKGMHLLHDVSDWDVAYFYTTLVDPDHSECIQTPAEFWPSRF